MRTCSIPDCDRPVSGHGLCKLHYNRWRRHNNPLDAGRGRGARTIPAGQLGPEPVASLAECPPVCGKCGAGRRGELWVEHVDAHGGNPEEYRCTWCGKTIFKEASCSTSGSVLRSAS